jgi:hypothetical protein
MVPGPLIPQVIVAAATGGGGVTGGGGAAHDITEILLEQASLPPGPETDKSMLGKPVLPLGAVQSKVDPTPLFGDPKPNGVVDQFQELTLFDPALS